MGILPELQERKRNFSVLLPEKFWIGKPKYAKKICKKMKVRDRRCSFEFVELEPNLQTKNGGNSCKPCWGDDLVTFSCNFRPFLAILTKIGPRSQVTVPSACIDRIAAMHCPESGSKHPQPPPQITRQ